MNNYKYNTKDAIKFEDAKKLVGLLANEDPRMALYIALGIYTGLRHSDTIRITKSDVVENTIESIEIKTKKYARRTLPKSFYELTKCINIDDFPEQLFLNKRRTQLVTIQYVGPLLKSYCAHYLKSDPRVIGTHTIRKTFGRRFYELHDNKSEAELKLSIIFNHANVQVTRTYLGITAEEIQDVIEMM